MLEAMAPAELQRGGPDYTFEPSEVAQSVAAVYLLEQQEAAWATALEGVTSLDEYDARYQALAADTPRGRRDLLYRKLLARNTPPEPVGEPDFNDLMAQDAARNVRFHITLDQSRGVNLRDAKRIDRGLTIWLVTVSSEQAQWELAHGMGRYWNARNLVYSHDTNVGWSQDKVFGVWRGVRNAFAVMTASRSVRKLLLARCKFREESPA